jgi:protoporphyrinogen oxidase
MTDDDGPAAAQPGRHQARVAVLGAGPMGLAVAYELLKRGCPADIYERDDRIGSMSASTLLDGLKIERYYHFIRAPDETLFECLRELGIADRLRWRETRMGFYFQGRLYDWGNPVALLRFPGLDLVSKLRCGFHVLHTKGIRDWTPLDRVPCTDWLKRWVGDRAYEVLWRSLFEQKFYEYKASLSAAWLGTRIKRVALSRKSAFVERLGYLEGGSAPCSRPSVGELASSAGGCSYVRGLRKSPLAMIGSGSSVCAPAQICAPTRTSYRPFRCPIWSGWCRRSPRTSARRSLRS